MGWQNVSSDKTRLIFVLLVEEKMSEQNIHEHRNRTRTDSKWEYKLKVWEEVMAW